MTHLIAGAYAAAPPQLASDAAAEARWYELLRSEPLIDGLELPWTGTLHPSGLDHLLSLLEPSWRSVVTAIPGTAQRVATNPLYGLASDDQHSRAQAVRDIEGLFGDVQRIRSAIGPDAVTAVELHSAPNRHGASSSAESFASSLAEIASWNWNGVALAIEHCDAGLPAGQSQKGFLSLQEEIAAVQQVNAGTRTRLGLTVNWGRSAIEARGPEGPVQHVSEIAEASDLLGVMFSGASGVSTVYGGAFADVHVPVHGTEAGTASDSLMTLESISRTLDAAGPKLLYSGVKVAAVPGEVDLEARLLPLRRSLEAVQDLTL
ncbi:DUF4862 family protein [Arthrobacter sp. M4]|uniref:DUF4862 family protein n=1 Tax=Arthrobacter sp. M4 TaxID=218160 RepID=UPI001CDBFBBA|nr:DUF4862 family protein [Arthrobacter sp. M4]MCA4134126.1 DUF4862 family protein [Arthrobacter sp. M4]